MICAAGLLGGLATGGFVVYASGLWRGLDRALGLPLQAVTTDDLLSAAGSFAVVFLCAWFGTWAGLSLAARV